MDLEKMRKLAAEIDVEKFKEMNMETVHVSTEVILERKKQDLKWGPQNHDPLKWIAILGEEFGEVAKAVLEKDLDNYREELIQVAAVAMAAVESLDRLKNDVSGS